MPFATHQVDFMSLSVLAASWGKVGSVWGMFLVALLSALGKRGCQAPCSEQHLALWRIILPNNRPSHLCTGAGPTAWVSSQAATAALWKALSVLDTSAQQPEPWKPFPSSRFSGASPLWHNPKRRSVERGERRKRHGPVPCGKCIGEVVRTEPNQNLKKKKKKKKHCRFPDSGQASTASN